VACGKITLDQALPPSDAGSGELALPRAEVRAQLAGLCIAKAIVRTSTQECPRPEDLADCASTHCDLDACLRECADYTACLDGEAEPCASSCPATPACTQCAGAVASCAIGHCVALLNCAVPTPHGPCSKVEACCAQQGGGRAAYCLDALRKLEMVSGDPSCVGLMYDADFNRNFANNPRCDFGFDAGF